MENKKLKTVFDISLALAVCFDKLNKVFEDNGLDIKLKVESCVIPKDGYYTTELINTELTENDKKDTN